MTENFNHFCILYWSILLVKTNNAPNTIYSDSWQLQNTCCKLQILDYLHGNNDALPRPKMIEQFCTKCESRSSMQPVICDTKMDICRNRTVKTKSLEKDFGEVLTFHIKLHLAIGCGRINRKQKKKSPLPGASCMSGVNTTC